MALRFHWRLTQGGELSGASRGLQQSLQATGIPDLEPQTRFCQAAEECGIDSLLTDFGWAKPDSILLAGALGMRTERIQFIVAYRSGLMCPTTFVQQINTLSHLIDGRLSINVVAGHSPEEQRYYGDFLSHDERYERTSEFLAVCNRFWRNDEPVNYEGKYYRIENGRLNTPFRSRERPAPELFIAGNSDGARRLAFDEGSCWMMIADAPEKIRPLIRPLLDAGKTAGVRLSVIARQTRDEALRDAQALVKGAAPAFDDRTVERSFVTRSDSHSIRATFALAEQEWVTPWLWTGAVRTHGAPAIVVVGAYDDVASAFLEYGDAGVTQFIISGWPKLEEMQIFGREILPRIRAAEAARR
jgi:alkanesulfonate monooxygenase